MPTVALLVAFVIAIVLAVGVTYMPTWASLAMIAIGAVLMVGAALTLIGLVGELMIVMALAGLVVRAAIHVTSCFRRHRSAGPHSA